MKDLCITCGRAAHHDGAIGRVCCRCFQLEFDHCANIRSLAAPGPTAGRLRWLLTGQEDPESVSPGISLEIAAVRQEKEKPLNSRSTN